MRKVEVLVYGQWVEGWTFGNKDASGRIGIKMGKPSGPSDWFLPEYVREPNDQAEARL